MPKSKPSIKTRTTCRISGERLTPLFTLGKLYISGFIPKKKQPSGERVELKMMLAPKSGLVQLAHTAPSDDMYREYWYRSGTNETMTRELESIALSTSKLMRLKSKDVFVDIGCNDGTLLSFLGVDLIRVGFDPAKNKYIDHSRKHANHIVNNYFTCQNFKDSPYGHLKAKVVTSIAMFYDLEHPDNFVDDVYQILDDDGLWVIQMSYLPLMLNQLAFDNICHEHLEYYSLTSLKYLLDRHNFTIVDCQLNDVNGGSFRIYIRKNTANPSTFATAPYRDVAQFRVNSVLAYEKSLKLTSPKTYADYFKKIEKLKHDTLSFIKQERAKGKKIWAYGASTKGNTLLQWFGLNEKHIDGIAERSPAKFGLKTVGSNIPIFSEEEMRKAKPDYLLVLPWHFIDEFVKREQEFLSGGGKFIVPCPRFEIIGKEESAKTATVGFAPAKKGRS